MKKLETEKKYYSNDVKGIIKIASLLGFEKMPSENEVDEYFTDIDESFIKNRTCLRIRKKNNEKMEITFKGKSNSLSNLYSKTEINISACIDEYDDYINLFSNLGYKSYVIVDKDRITYNYKDDRFEYNIMIDQIIDVGTFTEFQILSSGKESKIILDEALNKFIGKFNKINLREADKPYRDIVAEKRLISS